jgi:single-stranded-DNA-specific exonuclease
MTIWEPKNNHGKASALQIRGKRIPQPIVQILKNRGYDTPQSIENFFAPSLSNLHDPLLMRDMDKAVARIIDAIRGKEKILIHGDYDTDGITGTALLTTNLRRFGIDVHHYIPHRLEEGYGLSISGIKMAIAEQCSLVITVDCGSGALSEIEHANERNIDVIVCDHHEPKDVLPRALALINPKLPGNNYPFKELAGVGVAFKLLTAIYQELRQPIAELYQDLDLVALGSVVDIVPLVDENRTLVKYGMKRMLNSKKKGMQALLKETGLSGEITSYHLGFIVGPRINACGRMHDAKNALELFLTEDMRRALAIARSLSIDNDARKEIQDKTYQAAASMIHASDLARNRVIVLAEEGWHEGVVGIVASRIASDYFRPAIVLSVKNDVAKGSARSIPGFDITEAIGTCREILTKYGGHAQAAGLELDLQKLQPFKVCVNEFAQRFESTVFEKRSYYDIKLGLSDITDDVVHFLKYFEPTGIANPQPLFLGEDLEVVGVPRVVGTNQNHLMISLRQHGKVFPAIAYDRADDILDIEVGKTRVNCLYSIADDAYLGKRKTTLTIKEMTRIKE